VGSVVVVEGWPCVLVWGLVDKVAAVGERRGEERGHRGVSASHQEAATAMRVGGSEAKVGKWLRHEQAAEVTTVTRVMRQVAAVADEWARDADARAWDTDTRAQGADTRAWDAGTRARDTDAQARLASYPVLRVGAATRHRWVTEVRVDRAAWASSRRAGKGMPTRGCELMVVGGVRLSLLAWGQGVEVVVREEM
jgi:hypothetical protein